MVTELTLIFFSLSSLCSAPRSYPKPLIIHVALCCAESIRGISSEYNIQSIVSTTHSHDFYCRIVMFCVATPFLITLNTIYFFLWQLVKIELYFYKSTYIRTLNVFCIFYSYELFPIFENVILFYPPFTQFCEIWVYNSDSSQWWNQISSRLLSVLFCNHWNIFKVSPL